MEVHEVQPVGFVPAIKVCGAFIQHDDQFLLLKRHPDKSHGNHWNLPAGKLEVGETTLDAALREVEEECGIILNKEHMAFLGVLYFVSADVNFEFHIYFSKFEDKPSIFLADDETIDSKWWSPEDIIEPLIPGGKEVLSFCKKRAAWNFE